jgi:hypothetical protein
MLTDEPDAEPRQTFRQWLRDQRERDDWVGDLARDADLDGRWPRGRQPSLDRLVSYLHSRNACSEAVRALIMGWNEWCEPDEQRVQCSGCGELGRSDEDNWPDADDPMCPDCVKEQSR